MKCSICQREIPIVGGWVSGNNASPVNDGRCCDECNYAVVVPARLQAVTSRKAAEVSVGKFEIELGGVLHNVWGVDQLGFAFTPEHGRLLAASEGMYRCMKHVRQVLAEQGPPYSPAVSDCIDMLDESIASAGRQPDALPS